jgi:hypothetical protein
MGHPPRYYNPLTGRFLSRDPEKGKPYDPKTLHKYLYASGDPVNSVDPRGREALIEYGTILVQNIEEIVGPELLYEEMEHILLCEAFDLLEEQFADDKFPWFYCEAGSL